MNPSEIVQKVKELSQHVGGQALWNIQGVGVMVLIREVKPLFGRVDILIEPVTGRGQRWVDLKNLTLKEG